MLVELDERVDRGVEASTTVRAADDAVLLHHSAPVSWAVPSTTHPAREWSRGFGFVIAKEHSSQ